MSDGVRLELATGPVSWGVDFADTSDNPSWDRVLDGIVSAGYRWTELGPLGYLPADVADELAARGLGLTGGFVFEPIHDSRRRDAVLQTAAEVAERVAAVGGRFLVIIDEVSPARARSAGRPDAALRLDSDARTALRTTVAQISEIARASGLRPVLHPHAGTHLEFEDEIEPLLDVAELCLDTGHWLYAGQDPVAAYERWSERVPYLHLKDLDGGMERDDFWEAVRRGVFRPLGDGCLDLPSFIGALRRCGFDGWAVVEQDGPRDRDPIADLARSRRLVEELI